jgi:hypothetical protein
MSNKQNDNINEMVQDGHLDYFKDNPRILCPVCKERTFRVKGFDRNGNKRTYEMCMQCKIDKINNDFVDWSKKYV